MGDLLGVDQRGELALLGIDHGDLVRLVRRGEEVALGRVPAAVVQEARRRDGRHLEILDVLVVDEEDLAGLLDVDDEVRVLVRGDDGRHARLRMILLRVDGETAGRDDLQWLERVAVHDHVLRRPVGAGYGVAVLPALVFGRLHRACLEADLDLGHGVRLLEPEIDEVDLGVTADGVDVAPRGGEARDVHGIARVDDVDDLLAVAVDQRDLAAVAKGHREEILDVVAVHLLLRSLVDGHQDLPCGLHLRHAVLGRLRRLVLQIARHEIHFLGVELARAAPVRHACRGAEVDEHLEVFRAARLRDVGRERLAGGALAQHAVTARAALEVDALGLLELRRAERRCAGGNHLIARQDLRRRALVLELGIRAARMLLGLLRAGGGREQSGRAGGDGGAGDGAGGLAGRPDAHCVLSLVRQDGLAASI